MAPTALVHEAYLRLVDQRRVQGHNRAHSFAIAAQMMRRSWWTTLGEPVTQRACAESRAMTASRIFLLSPANAAGPRGRLLRTSPNVPLAARLRSGEGVPLGEVYTFISALYFRGKLAYADCFAPGRSFVITPCLGLLEPSTPVREREFEQLASVPIDAGEPRYLEPLRRDLVRLSRDWPGDVVLLGSIASPKYTQPLIDVLGSRLVFPSTFVGRGDMSRGGVLLRAVRAGQELDYIPVSGAALRGTRPPRLPKP